MAASIHDSIQEICDGVFQNLLLPTWIRGAGEREKHDTVLFRLNRQDLVTAILSEKKCLSFSCVLQNSEIEEAGKRYIFKIEFITSCKQFRIYLEDWYIVDYLIGAISNQSHTLLYSPHQKSAKHAPNKNGKCMLAIISFVYIYAD